jgi:hypothetical protein
MEGLSTTAEPERKSVRLDWRREALAAGFAPREADHLAFWRWHASQRGEISRRVVPRESDLDRRRPR